MCLQSIFIWARRDDEPWIKQVSVASKVVFFKWLLLLNLSKRDLKFDRLAGIYDPGFTKARKHGCANNGSATSGTCPQEPDPMATPVGLSKELCGGRLLARGKSRRRITCRLPIFQGPLKTFPSNPRVRVRKKCTPCHFVPWFHGGPHKRPAQPLPKRTTKPTRISPFRPLRAYGTGEEAGSGRIFVYIFRCEPIWVCLKIVEPFLDGFAGKPKGNHPPGGDPNFE